MKSIVLLLSAILFVTILPYSNAHPDTKAIYIATPDGMIPDDRIIGLFADKQEEVTELFTEKWFWQNFSLLLGMGVTLLIGSTMSITFREEIVGKIKTTKSHTP